MIAQKDKLLTRPRLVLGYADSAHAAQCARGCRRQGWEVHQTGSGREARRLAGIIEPALVVLDIHLPDESGWLTAAKMLLERPHQKILLVGAERSTLLEQHALFLGAAAFVAREDITAALEDFLAEPFAVA